MEQNKGREILSVENLVVEYTSGKDTVHAVNDVSFKLNAGETLGLVGETGAGKTTIAKSIMRILPFQSAKIINGAIKFDGKPLLDLDDQEMRRIRGNRISMIFQDPMTALNPTMRVGRQIAECIKFQDGVSWKKAEKRALDIFRLVGISEDRFREYPHQFSGGMKQRVVIAIALACGPDILIADEPTSALDVTIQAQILETIGILQEKQNLAVIMITHDFGVVAKSCDYVGVIYAGQLVEYGTKEQVFDDPLHPYTNGLFNAIPSLTSDVEELDTIHGLPPDPTNLPTGCYFEPRCPYRTAACCAQIPMRDAGNGHLCRCTLTTAAKEGVES